ncbi:hypothetical protein CDAR_258491 [Caerostris darwini]|uniref:Uncharacterized protein n=1 Tax=Caerostris darwini TaxID=1538125 RepID=A0AAV4RIF9_9ARAC|nr:hypothetical protein CDAR_258491 [Caerostris darwini]
MVKVKTKSRIPPSPIREPKHPSWLKEKDDWSDDESDCCVEDRRSCCVENSKPKNRIRLRPTKAPRVHAPPRLPAPQQPPMPSWLREKDDWSDDERNCCEDVSKPRKRIHSTPIETTEPPRKSLPDWLRVKDDTSEGESNCCEEVLKPKKRIRPPPIKKPTVHRPPRLPELPQQPMPAWLTEKDDTSEDESECCEEVLKPKKRIRPPPIKEPTVQRPPRLPELPQQPMPAWLTEKDDTSEDESECCEEVLKPKKRIRPSPIKEPTVQRPPRFPELPQQPMPAWLREKDDTSEDESECCEEVLKPKKEYIHPQ